MGATEFDQRLLTFIQTLNTKRQSSHAPSEIVALDHLLHEMRLFKSRAESSVMRQSAKIAVAAHARAMLAAKPGMMEYELEAEFLHEFRRNGADCSYPADRRHAVRTPACCTTARTTRSSPTAISC